MTRETDPADAPAHFTVASHFFQVLTDYTARHGLPTAQLLASAGLPAELPQGDANGRIAFADFSRLCDVAAQALGDPCLGLKLGQGIRPGHLGSHGFALMSCSTALELAQQSERYSALTIDAGHNVVEVRGDQYVRVFRSNLPGQPSLGRLQDELQHAIAVTLARWFTNRDDLNPSWVSFQHARPADTREYEALFRCPVHFGATETAIGVDAHYMDLPMPQANAQVRRIMDDLCAQLVKQLGSSLEPNWLAAARRAALQAFQQGVPEVADIARAAGMDEVTFKDQLSSRGLSFRGFIDDLRHALAIGYMRDPALGLVDIAYLLGFSEQSAFQRAFKRWTGQTPGEYRRHPLHPSGPQS